MFRAVFGAALIAAFSCVASAATFTVTDPTEFQAALTAAQANGEGDTINVAGGIYNVMGNGTLTYTAVASENFGLTVNGADSTLVTLDGGSQVPILRIDTRSVSPDDGVIIDVNDMTFRNGNAAGTPDDGGALAILLDESNQPADFAVSVVVSGSEFYNNRADDDGGAVYIRGIVIEGLTLFDLTFDGNLADGDGGAAYVAGWVFNTPVSVVDVDFFSNNAGGNGGALVVEGFDEATPSEDRTNRVELIDITFWNNQSLSVTGGGGGADIAALDTTVELVAFVENRARDGAGMRLRPSWSSLIMFNSGFVGNTATGDGGGLAALDTFFNELTITNNTFTQNLTNNRGGGAIFLIDSSAAFASIYNNIMHANTAPQGADLYVDNRVFNDMGAPVDLFNNIIADFVVTPVAPTTGGNINQAPTFVDIGARPVPDPRLTAGSVGIDDGDNNAPRAPAFDFEGDARPFDGDGDMTATIDIGVDEYTGLVIQDADLAVTKSDSPDPVTEGGEITYTITVTNNGPGDATTVTMIDTLSGLVSFVSVNQTQGNCVPSLGAVSCTLGDIANGASATVTIVVMTPDVAVDTVVTNIVSVSGAENDPVSENDSATEETLVVPAGPATAELELVKTGSPDPVISGG